MKKIILLPFLIVIFTLPIMSMDSWPKDKPVPFTSLPIEFIIDAESGIQQPLDPKACAQESKDINHGDSSTTPLPRWWANGGEPSPKIVAQYQQRSWQWGDGIAASQEAVDKSKEFKNFSVPKEVTRYEDLRKLEATANYDDIQKSCLMQQLLFKNLCVHAWDIINPFMDPKGDKALHDFLVKLKRRAIDFEQNPVALTKKDLHHRLLTFVLTDGTHCRINDKYMALVFKHNIQNGMETEEVSADYDFEAEKEHQRQTAAKFENILDKVSRMDEIWHENPHQ